MGVENQVARLSLHVAVLFLISCASRPPGSGPGPGGDAGPPPTPSFLHGINLGNRLDAPNEGDWGAVLHDSDFAVVASRPFDHVRLPVRFSAHAQGAAPFALDEVFMRRVDWALDQALANGLSVVLDLHHYTELHQNPEGHRARFLALWRQIATRYAGRPPAVAFELLNEPQDALVAQWNDLAIEAIAAVRESNSTRTIIVDAAPWAGASSLGALALPDDPNVLASVHTYDPVLFSLQGGDAWAGPVFATKGIIYPGPPASPIQPAPSALAEPWADAWFQSYNTLTTDQNPCGRQAIVSELNLVATYVASTGHRVYNGEWGVSEMADLGSRAAWMRDVRRESERVGAGWATWDNGTDDRLFDPATGAWNQTLLGALFDR